VYARVLGTLLARAFLALRQIAPDLIVPIPLHPQRYRERGFNQAHEIARYAAQLLRIPVGTQYVRRRVPTLEQSGLSLAQRRRNVRGAFEVVRAIEARSVALVDDVLTTGSTARAAAEALSNAGVRHVEVWAVARVTLD
jgi:ComF family protein